MWTAETLALIAGTFFLAGFVKGTIGLGLPTVSLAILTATLGLREAMALMLVPSLVTNLWQAVAGPYFIEIIRRFWTIAVMAVIGIFIGLRIGIGVEPNTLAGLLGLLLCFYAVSGLGKLKFTRVRDAEKVWNPFIGLASGLMTGLAGVFLVPGALYLQALQLRKELFVQTLGVLFVAATVGLGVGLARYELVSLDQAVVSSAALVPALAGMRLGQKVRVRLSEDRFRSVLFSSLACVGIYLIVRAFV